MKRLLAVVLALSFASPAFAWKTPSAEQVKTDEVSVVRWEGDTDLDMLHRVISDIERAKDGKKKVLRATLLSGGGPVITSLEIAREVHKASEDGLIVEIHGTGMIASGATWVLAAGTPGKRFVGQWTAVLVHALQVGGGFFSPPSCGSFKQEAKNETDKLINALLLIMRDAYVHYTGKAPETVEEWLSCGFEQAGSGKLAVELGLADKVE